MRTCSGQTMCSHSRLQSSSLLRMTDGVARSPGRRQSRVKKTRAFWVENDVWSDRCIQMVYYQLALSHIGFALSRNASLIAGRAASYRNYGCKDHDYDGSEKRTTLIFIAFFYPNTRLHFSIEITFLPLKATRHWQCLRIFFKWKYTPNCNNVIEKSKKN